MLSIYAFDASGPRQIDDPDQISELIARPDTVVWADLVKPSDEDLRWIQCEFGIEQLSMDDVRRPDQRPKLELFPTYGMLVAYASSHGDDHLCEVDVLVGADWLVSIHEHKEGDAHFDLDAVRERVQRNSPTALDVSFLLYVVLDEIVDTYFGAVDRLGDEIDDVEEKIFSDEDPEGDERPLQHEMLQIRKRLLGFRRRVVPMREVLMMLLRDDLPFIDPRSHHFFQDVFDHVMRITDEIDNQRELIGNAVDAHLAMVSNQMNHIMKKMTSWGAILIVSTLIAGIYGMNFDEMPELHWRFGYAGALGVMAAVTVGLYLYFKRKRWL